MKKIIVGLLSIVLTVGATAGIAYADYSSSINLNNVSFTLDTAPGLEIAINNGTPTTGPVDLTSDALTGLQPGKSVTIPVAITNTGSAGQVTYALSAQLVSANTGSDWTNLSPLITASFGSSGPSDTLQQWNAGPVDLGVTVAPGATVNEDITITLSNSADDSVAGHTVSTNWVLTGTQTP
jgi:hypothetical protein